MVRLEVSATFYNLAKSVKWRRERESNPRYTFVGIHTISSRAPSAARTSLPEKQYFLSYGRSVTSRYLSMAERGGFEPPWELVTPKSISSRSRYDHFGTSPHRINRSKRLLPSFAEKIYSKFPRIPPAIFLPLFPPDDSIFHQSKYYIMNPPLRILDHAPRK